MSFVLLLFFSVSAIYAQDNTTDLENTHIDADDVSLYYKNGTRLNIQLQDANNHSIPNEKLIVNINNVNYTRTTNDAGRTSMNINLIPGKYLANIYFLGNDKYSASNKSVNVNVLSTVSGQDLVKYYRNATQYRATFLDGSGEPLTHETVTFNINGVMYNRQTNQNGVAQLNINLNSGNYILTAYNPVNGFSYSNNITVLSTLNGSDVNKIYRDSKQYLTTFRDFKGNPLRNTNVTFNINGVFYTRNTHDNGIARLNIWLNPGQYIITAYNNLTGEAFSNKITVYDYSDTSLYSKNYTFMASDDDTIEVLMTDRFDYGISGENINLNVNNRNYTSTTNSNGVATFYVDLNQGNYSLTFTHAATSRYAFSSLKTNLETYDALRVSFYGENRTIINGDEYSVTLYDENGTPFSNQTVYFDIASKIYSAVTDINGAAALKINMTSGIYDVRYFFNSTGYKFARGFSEIMVIKDAKTRLTPLTSMVTQGISENLEVLLSADNVKLPNQKVIIEINGVNYTKTTNKDGIAKLAIRLMSGVFDVNYYYSGDGMFEKSMASSKLTVKERILTSFNVLAGSAFHKNAGITYDIQLTAGNALADKSVSVQIGSKTYDVKTDGEGIVRLNINDLNVGNYNINFKFSGDSVYAPSEGSRILTISAQIPYGYSYWVRYNHMNSLNLASLASQGTKHIFLHSYAFTAYGENSVVSWIKTANSYGINVHIWMQVFYGSNGWVRPVNDDGSFKYSYFNSKINEAKHYAGLSGVAGIHFDYLRFGGTAHYYSTSSAAINYFVSQASSAVKGVNSACLLSAAVMPEPGMLDYYYGQDIPTISKYLDIIVPMIYKGNYGKNTAWIQQTTQWFVDNSNGAQVWSGLQTYRSDNDITVLSYNELFNDAQASLNGGARGVTLFRWGLTSYINFNSLTIR